MQSLYEIALILTPGIGGVTARSLIAYFGSAEAVFNAKQAQLMMVPGIGIKTAESILRKESFDRAEKELLFAERYKIQILSFNSPGYPHRLKLCYDAPLVLYYKGNADLNASKVISIVGTRKATAYGKELTQKLVEELKAHNVIVVSGLAHGIDGIAHKACVKEGVPTVGVVGHGLDRIYPAQHRALAEKMLADGGILTEFVSGTNPDRENFPKRNRIVAGMADATIIVEASITGGALITAELANSYNRDVFAFPGNINEEYSTGCNHLIKTNRANLITGIKDIEYLLGWTVNQAQERPTQLSLGLTLEPEEKIIVDVLNEKKQLGIDQLSIETQMLQSKLVITLLGLEMQGIVTGLPGKMYKLT